MGFLVGGRREVMHVPVGVFLDALTAVVAGVAAVALVTSLVAD